jgi:hypothetical protein
MEDKECIDWAAVLVKEFDRLTGLRGAGSKTDKHRSEYLDWLWEVTPDRDEKKLRRFITHLLRTEESFPSLRKCIEMWTLLNPVQPKECPRCEGTGYILIEKDGETGQLRCPACAPRPRGITSSPAGNSSRSKSLRAAVPSLPLFHEDNE